MRKALSLVAALGLTIAALAAPASGGPTTGGLATDNIEHVKHIPLAQNGVGGRLIGKWFYMNDQNKVMVYDVSDPLNPEMVGYVPMPQEWQFSREDIDGNGDILVVPNTASGQNDGNVQTTSPANAVSLMRRRIVDRLVPRPNVTVESALIGRGDTMKILTSLLSEAKTGKGTAFLVQGDAGIGKSRVLEEVSQFASLQGFSCIRVNCRPSHATRPLSAFVEAAPLLRSLPGAIGCAPENLQFLDRLTLHKPHRDDPMNRGAEPAWIFGGIQRALFDLIDAVGDESPLFIQMEDLHWLDDASADILAELIDRSPKHVLVGMTARGTPKVWDQLKRHPVRLCLEPLTGHHAADVILSITQGHGRSMDATSLEWCVRVAEGNPYFLTELATHWVDFRLDHKVPSSLSVVLDNRLARLDQDSLQLLQTCALLENNATLSRIEAVLEYKAFQLLASIETLASSGMIVMDRGDIAPNARLNTKHELLSTAALQRLSVAGRRFLNRRIGQVLEKEIDDHFSAATLWDCAKHWQLAGDTKRALHLATSCASYLQKVGLPLEAASAYEKSMAFCVTDNQRVEILKCQTAAFFAMSAWSNVLETSSKVRNLERRVPQATTIHDEIELMELRAQWQSFDWHSVLTKTIECLSAETASVQHRAEAGVMALMLSGMQCDRRRSIAIYRSLDKMIANGGVAAATALQARMVFNVDHGDIFEGVAAASQLIEDARTRGDLGEEFRETMNAAMACRVAGRFGDAETYYCSALDLATTHGLSFAEQRALPMFAHMALELGRVDQARDLYKRLLSIPAGTADKLRLIQQQAIGVRLALCNHNPDEAMKLLPFSLQEIITDRIYSKRTYNLALLVAVELAVNGVASTSATNQLEKSFLKARSTQHQAFSAFVLYVALRQHGATDKARRMLSDYENKYRREPWPAPRHLLKILEGALPDRALGGKPRQPNWPNVTKT